jgi:hypothetical protein
MRYYIDDISAADDAAARRAAKKVGLRAVRSRWRRHSVDNMGGYQLLDAYSNTVIDGVRLNLTADALRAASQRNVLASPPMRSRRADHHRQHWLGSRITAAPWPLGRLQSRQRD